MRGILQATVCFCCLILIFYVTYNFSGKKQAELNPIVVTATSRHEIIEIHIPEQDLLCMAKNIYHEARGESTVGKLAVAHVTMNRVNNSRFPDTVCDVVYQAKHSKWWLEAHGKQVPVRNKCQFSWYCDGKSDNIVLKTSDGKPIVKNMIAWQESLRIAKQVLLNSTADPTNGATHYYNPTLAQPYWKDHYQRVAVVENHAFYK